MTHATSGIHPTAIIHPTAELDTTVIVGPYAVIGAGVRIGAGVSIGAHAVIEGPTEIGADCTIHSFAAIGGPPQDLRYKGEPTRLAVGRGNIIREFVTFHRGTPNGGGETIIGDNNMFMSYTHVAHDCHVGSHVIMANGATLGGHVTVGDRATFGGLVGVHQFVRIGGFAMIGGGAIVTQDVPPYVNAAGNRARMFGLNLIGLKRQGFSSETISALKSAYRLLFRSAGLTFKKRIDQVHSRFGHIPEVKPLLDFVEASDRGICQGRWEKRGGLLG